MWCYKIRSRKNSSNLYFGSQVALFLWADTTWCCHRQELVFSMEKSWKKLVWKYIRFFIAHGWDNCHKASATHFWGLIESPLSSIECYGDTRTLQKAMLIVQAYILILMNSLLVKMGRYDLWTFLIEIDLSVWWVDSSLQPNTHPSSCSVSSLVGWGRKRWKMRRLIDLNNDHLISKAKRWFFRLLPTAGKYPATSWKAGPHLEDKHHNNKHPSLSSSFPWAFTAEHNVVW